MFVRLLLASYSGALKFPTLCCQILTEELDLVAATFYTVTGDKSNLILRGLSGFDYKDFASLLLPITTMAGSSFQTGKPFIEKALSGATGYRDVILIEKHGLKSAAVLPLFRVLDGTFPQQATGVFCLYPKSHDTSFDEGTLNTLMQFVSLSYSEAIERTKTVVRANFLGAIGKSGDLNSMFHRLTKTLVDQLGIEAASIYTYERNARALRLRGTTGLIATEISKTDAVFRATEHNSPTLKCFQAGNPIEVESDAADFDSFPEATNSEKKQVLLFPIRRVGKTASSAQCNGVLRILNRVFASERGTYLVPFSNEDYELVEFVAEMVAVLLHMFSGRENQLPYFEKIMHGTKSTLTASIQNLDLLEQRGNVLKTLPSHLHYTIHDTKEWLLDIKNQMERLESPARHHYASQTVKIAGEVLAPVVSYFERSGANRSIPKVLITNLHDAGFFTLPEVLADPAALVTVFRNLAENALKYREFSARECRVELAHSLQQGKLRIAFKDYGIGVLAEDASLIFDEGFRSDAAAAQDPTGTGLGLTQSRDIMRKLGGELELISTKPTTFCVTIKVKV